MWLTWLLICGGGAAPGADLDPQLVGVWPGESRGSARAVAVAGNRAYVVTSQGLQVIDVSNPAQPRWVSGHDTGKWPYGLPASTNFVYLPDPDEVWVVNDVRDPAHPKEVGGYRTIASVMGVSVVGTYAYAAAGEVAVIDISDPANPRRVAGVPGRGMGVVCLDVTADARYAIAAGNICVFDVIDISDPLHPRFVGGNQNEEGACCPNEVVAQGSYAYVASCQGDIDIFDFSDPANPHSVGGYPLLSDRGAVSVAGNLACVVNWDGLIVIDIRSPATPRRVGAYKTFRRAVDVAVSGQYAYLADAEAGLLVIDISRLANPQRVGDYPVNRTGWDSDYAVAVGVESNLACVAVNGWDSETQDYVNRLEVVDVTNPASPQHVGTWRADGEANQVVVSGHHAYVARAWLDEQTQKWQRALEVIDLSTPANPERVGTVLGVSGPLAVWGSYVYAAGEGWDAQGQTWQRALEVIDVSTPAEPKRAGSLNGVSGRLAVSGNRAYVRGERNDGGNWVDGLRVVDISDPADPRLVGEYETSEWSYGLPVVTNLTCVADPEAGWQVVDVGNPAEPNRVGPYSTIAAASGIAMSGNYGYVMASWPEGLQAIDLSDPRTPRHVGGNSAFEAWDGIIEGNRVYVAAGHAGMAILGLYEPPPQLEALHVDRDGFHLVLRGVNGEMLRVERSRDLRTWEPFATVPIPASGQSLIDPAATTDSRLFYRAVRIP